MLTFQPKSRSIGYILISTFLVMSVVLLLGLFFITQANFNRYINESVDIQTDEISKQIVYNYENFTDTIINTSNIIQERLLNDDLSITTAAAKDFFNDAIMLNQSLINVTIFDIYGNLIVDALDEVYVNALTTDWYQGALLDATTYYFSSPIKDDDEVKLVISKFISINHHQDNAVLKLEIDFNRFIELALNANLGKYGHVTIFNNDYQIIYSSKTDGSLSDENEIVLFKKLILGGDKTSIHNESMMLTIETITNTPWRIGIFINIQSSSLVRNSFIITLILFLIIFAGLWTLIYIFIAKRITSPLVTLGHKMSQIESAEDFKLNPVSFDYPREVEVLSHSFNVLMDRIDSLLNQVIIEQKEQRKSELWALQNQINPHFLYNTLDSIVWMVENEENQKAVKMIIALSRLFKISISGGANMIDVKSEIEHARHYLFIQSFRFKDKFRYEIIIEDEEVLKQKMLKLILQPLIENAIYHGIDKTSTNGLIIIRAGLENNHIVLSVEDNGYGLTTDKIDALYQKMRNQEVSGGVGLKNVYQRLKVYYQDKANVTITSEEDLGTKIKITIPMEDIA